MSLLDTPDHRLVRRTPVTLRFLSRIVNPSPVGVSFPYGNFLIPLKDFSEWTKRKLQIT